MKLLEKLSAAIAPSGCEDNVREIIRGELKGGEVTSDALGSLIYRKKGTGRRLMLTAFLDEPGFMVTDIDDKGFLHCHFFGGAREADFAHREVEFTDGCRGLMQSTGVGKTERGDLFVDIGAKSRAEAEERVKIGSVGTFACTPREDNGFVSGKALSARAGAAALAHALGRINTDADVYAVFAAQHLSSSRGAKAAAGAVMPDEVLSVGFAEADDIPKGDFKAPLGAGPLAMVGEKGFVAAKCVRDKLFALGLSPLVTASVNSDAAAAAEYGAPAGALLIPVRYCGTAEEKVCLEDVDAAAEIIVKYVNNWEG